MRRGARERAHIPPGLPSGKLQKADIPLKIVFPLYYDERIKNRQKKR